MFLLPDRRKTPNVLSTWKLQRHHVDHTEEQAKETISELSCEVYQEGHARPRLVFAWSRWIRQQAWRWSRLRIRFPYGGGTWCLFRVRWIYERLWRKCGRRRWLWSALRWLWRRTLNRLGFGKILWGDGSWFWLVVMRRFLVEHRLWWGESRRLLLDPFGSRIWALRLGGLCLASNGWGFDPVSNCLAPLLLPPCPRNYN